MRVEYENVFALGPMCGVADADDVLAASARCDELGIDTISAGGTIAWAMECAERGLIDAPWLRFGDGTALLRALDEIGTGTGLGPLLAEGSRRASEQVGQGSADFAPHVKGLELPGYEPRTLHAMALGLAVNARGADHNRSGAYEADLAGDLDRLDGGTAHVAAAIETEDRAAVMDSLILCKFLRGVFTERAPPTRRGSRGPSGRGCWPWSPGGTSTPTSCGPPPGGSCWPSAPTTCARAGARGRLAAAPAARGVPAAGLRSRPPGSTPDRLRAMVDGYWAARGLDAQGRPVTGVPAADR